LPPALRYDAERHGAIAFAIAAAIDVTLLLPLRYAMPLRAAMLRCFDAYADVSYAITL